MLHRIKDQGVHEHATVETTKQCQAVWDAMSQEDRDWYRRSDIFKTPLDFEADRWDRAEAAGEAWAESAWLRHAERGDHESERDLAEHDAAEARSRAAGLGWYDTAASVTS